jgi:hypothetical protein
LHSVFWSESRKKGVEVLNSGRQRHRAAAMVTAAVVATAAVAALVSGAFGASITSAAFTGGSGTVTVDGKLYVKQNQTVTLNVVTSSDARCVSLSGAHTAVQTSGTAKSSWTFGPYTAGSGDGTQTVTVTVGTDFNSNNVCTKQTATSNAGYILDNTGPVIQGSRDPAANAALWNNADTTVHWSATDAGVGMTPGTTIPDTQVTGNTAGVTKTVTAADRLGNSGTGSLTVKIDKDRPTFDLARTPGPNANGWNNTDVTLSFGCADALSGIKSCTGGGTQVLSAEGSNLQATGTAIDNADNQASNPVTGVKIDKTAPSLTGAATTAPNGDGWYADDVKVHWNASDSLSGLDGAVPADTTITGEGANLAATEGVKDKAGNVAFKTVSGIRIDRTAPNTAAVAPTGWSASNASIELAPFDGLSGVKVTRYAVDGGSIQTGTHVQVSGDGVHSVEFWSVDAAGNAETHKSVELRIDGTAPAISHQLGAPANGNGWHNADVTITYTCSDATSGVASCGPDRVGANAVAVEGKDHDITGEAVDNAGNTAVDHALISLDKTAPTIAAAVDRAPNAAHWYDADVTVMFDCGDALSGVDHCPAFKVLGEGENQSVAATVSDAAGNEAGATRSDIDVDETAPSLTGAPTGERNGTGWYRDDVTVHWAASDALSGLDGPAPDDSLVAGEGGNLSASASVTDKAGNATSRTVDGIKIDRSAPVTTAHVAEALESGWYAGDVDVALSAIDPLSGVDATYYTVDGGDAKAYTGAFAFAAKGAHTIRFWSVDRAGNVETHDDAGHAVVLKIDGIAPTISGGRTPAANGFGWNNTPVDVTFDCADAESGIAGCSGSTTLSNEGAGQSATGNAVDTAGNTAEATVENVNIDLTPPRLSGAPTTAANAAGWHNGDVTIHWIGVDGLSGIDAATQPADATITGEGSDLGAGPVSIADKAGNMASASVSGVKIDRTPPTVAGKPTTAANAAGWYNGDVTVDFTCADSLSGVAFCPTSKVAAANGTNQSVSSGPAEDFAGNAAPGVTVSGLKIDSLAPQSSANNQCTKANGWCSGSAANVVITAADQAGLSGVKEIHYAIDGGAEQIAQGATKTVAVALDGTGRGTVEYYAVDVAGNREPVNAVALKWDNIAPTVTHTLAPVPNATGWNVADVTVHFDAKDDDSGSGVDASTVTPDITVQAETAGRQVDGSAKDLAGNLGTDSVTVRLDRTAPTVTGAIVEGTRGAGGWYTGPVKVAFTCSDAVSGIAVCPDPVTLTDNGAGQSVTGVATDNAGNKATVKIGGIDIDREKPAISVAGLKDGAVYTLGSVPVGSCTATDAVSGAGACTVSVSGGLANGVGTFVYVAKAADNAGNDAQVTGTFRVVYRFDGFLQPINDTAHQVGTATSMFKAGSTVPAKFQLKKADGSLVQATGAPAWLVPAKGALTTTPVDEAVYGDPAEAGQLYRYDATDRQYIYNWGSAKTHAGYYWRIGVKLDDGQTYYVNAGLR